MRYGYDFLTRRTFSAVIVSLAMGLGGAAAAQETVLLGSSHPLSGPLEFEGREAHQGVLVAADLINEAGGIASMDGARIEIVSEDNGADPERSTRQATRMAQDGVAAFLGTMSSGVALAMQPISERNRIPLVITAAADGEITERRLPYTFRAHADVGRSVEGAISALQAMSEGFGVPIKRVAHLRLEISAYKSLTTLLEERLPEAGMEFVGVASAPFSATDFSTQVTQIKQMQPDVLVISALLSQSIEIVQTMNTQEFRPPLMTGIAAAFAHPDFVDALPELSQNITDVSYWYDPESEEWSRFSAAYEEMFGTVPTTHAAQGYQSTMIVADALERAGTTDGKALRDALAATSLEDHLLPQEGPITFAEGGQNENVRSPLTQLQGRDAPAIYPVEFRQAEPVFPDPLATYEIGAGAE